MITVPILLPKLHAVVRESTMFQTCCMIFMTIIEYPSGKLSRHKGTEIVGSICFVVLLVCRLSLRGLFQGDRGWILDRIDRCIHTSTTNVCNCAMNCASVELRIEGEQRLSQLKSNCNLNESPGWRWFDGYSYRYDMCMSVVIDSIIYECKVNK